MIDAKQVNYDTPISAYKADLPNKEWHTMTLRQLASHTAGIPGYEENQDYWGAIGSIALTQTHTNVDEGLAYFDGSKLLFEPGTGFHYSSYDITLLSSVLQAAAKSPFQELIQSRVVSPLGLAMPITVVFQKEAWHG